MYVIKVTTRNGITKTLTGIISLFFKKWKVLFVFKVMMQLMYFFLGKNIYSENINKIIPKSLDLEEIK